MKTYIFIVSMGFMLAFTPIVFAAQDHNSTRSNRGSVVAETPDQGHNSTRSNRGALKTPDAPSDKNKKGTIKLETTEFKGRNPQTGKEVNVIANKKKVKVIKDKPAPPKK